MGIISDKFNQYAKWNAQHFNDFFLLDFLSDDETDGLAMHLKEIRDKTYVAVTELEAGVNANDAKITTNSSRLDTVDSTLATLQAGVNANDAKIVDNSTKIESLAFEYFNKTSNDGKWVITGRYNAFVLVAYLYATTNIVFDANDVNINFTDLNLPTFVGKDTVFTASDMSNAVPGKNFRYIIIDNNNISFKGSAMDGVSGSFRISLAFFA